MNHWFLYTPVLHLLWVAGLELGIYYLLYILIRYWIKKKKRFFAVLFDKHIHNAGLLLFISLILHIGISDFKNYLDFNIYYNIYHASQIILFAAMGYFVIKVIALLKEVILKLYERKKYKDFTMRSVRWKYGPPWKLECYIREKFVAYLTKGKQNEHALL